MYDLLIHNAEIVDGTRAPAYRGDVAVQGDRIAAIGALGGAQAETTLDAAGRTLVPGFIDAHSHADLALFAAPQGASLVHQGITTVVGGQCGLSPAPMTRANRREALSTINAIGAPKAAMPWKTLSTFAGYLAQLEQLGPAVNVAPLVGQGMVRSAVIGYGMDAPDAGQIERMQALVREAMEAGAFGISSGLIYPPGSFTPTEELIEVVRPLRDYGGLYFSHIRGESETLLDAIQEAIEIGRQAGVGVEICHLKAAGKAHWDKAPQALALIERARDEGLDVTADMYPYTAGATHLAVLMPKWAIAGGFFKALSQLLLPWRRARIIREMKAGTGGLVGQIPWDQVWIVRSSKPEYLFKSIADLAAAEDKDPYNWTLDALLKTRGNVAILIELMSEGNVRLQLAHEATMIGTDGFSQATEGPMATGMLHPRNFGTYPKLLGRYVRELGLLSLPEAVWKSTGFPAHKLGLSDRGRIRAGAKADLVLFHPDTIADRGTYTDPLHYPAGIEYVWVNGRAVIEQGQQTDARPGEVLRRA